MKIPLSMMTLLFRSMGQEQMAEMMDQLDREGFESFHGKRVGSDDPTWSQIGASDDTAKTGFWLTAVGPQSRLTIGIFFEGKNDELLSLFTVGNPALAAPLSA